MVDEAQKSKFSRDELRLMVESINYSIAYRLNNRSRMSEIKSLKNAKTKLEEELKNTL